MTDGELGRNRFRIADRQFGARHLSTLHLAALHVGVDQVGIGQVAGRQAYPAQIRAAQAQLQQLPPNTAPTDPAAAAQHKRQDAAATALSKAKADLQAAKDLRDGAAKAAAAAIHRAITHDGLHDSTWDKIDSAVGSALSDTGHFLEKVGETALSDLASLGNAMVHDLPAVGEVAGGLGLAALGAGGEVGGIALDATGIGAVLGVPAAAVSAVRSLVGPLSPARGSTSSPTTRRASIASTGHPTDLVVGVTGPHPLKTATHSPRGMRTRTPSQAEPDQDRRQRRETALTGARERVSRHPGQGGL